MRGPDFKGDYVNLTDRWSRRLRLYRETWSQKSGREDRWFLAHNYEKVEGAVADPDQVVRGRRDKKVCLYYRHYTEFRLDGAGRRTLTTTRFHVCVVANPSRKLVLTFYPAETIKDGKVLYDKTKGIDLIR